MHVRTRVRAWDIDSEILSISFPLFSSSLLFHLTPLPLSVCRRPSVRFIASFPPAPFPQPSSIPLYCESATKILSTSSGYLDDLCTLVEWFRRKKTNTRRQILVLAFSLPIKSTRVKISPISHFQFKKPYFTYAKCNVYFFPIFLLVLRHKSY